VGTQALFDVLTIIGERGVDAVVLTLESTPSLGQRDIDCVLRSLIRARDPSGGHRERGLASPVAPLVPPAGCPGLRPAVRTGCRMETGGKGTGLGAGALGSLLT